MVPAVTRRRLLTLSAGGLAGLTGCQSLSILDSSVPIQIHLLNTTDENLEVWVQLTSPESDVGNQLAESLLMEPGMAEQLEMRVPKATYQLRVLIDDTNPPVEYSTQWEVTGHDCAKRAYATVISSEAEISFRVLAQNCEHT